MNRAWNVSSGQGVRRLAVAATIAASLTGSGCSILAPDCGPEQRDTVASGEIPSATPSSEPFFSATVLTIEIKEDGGIREMARWYLVGRELKAHVTGAVLRDAETGDVLLEFPLDTHPTSAYIAIDLVPNAHRPLVTINHLRRRLRERQTVVEVTTDLPDQPLLRVPLTNVRAGDFNRGDCL
jgi:hypothetical protein